MTTEFIESGSTNWIDKIGAVIEAYNTTPHTALDGITPNDAINDPKKREYVMHLNTLKARSNGFVTDLTTGD